MADPSTEAAEGLRLLDAANAEPSIERALAAFTLRDWSLEHLRPILEAVAAPTGQLVPSDAWREFVATLRPDGDQEEADRQVTSHRAAWRLLEAVEGPDPERADASALIGQVERLRAAGKREQARVGRCGAVAPQIGGIPNGPPTEDATAARLAEAERHITSLLAALDNVERHSGLLGGERSRRDRARAFLAGGEV